MGETVSQALSDALLDEHLRMARVSARTRQAVLRQLALLEDDLASAIATADPSAPARLRARQLIVSQLTRDELRPLIQARYDSINEAVEDTVNRLVVFEVQTTSELLDAIAGIDVTRTDALERELPATVRNTLLPSVVTSQELSATASTWWLRQATNMEQRLFDQLNVGIVQGEDVRQLVRRLRGSRAQGFTDGLMALSRRDATRLVRTQFASVANTVQVALYDVNAGSLDAIEHLSTLDGRTSLICIGRSGLRYTVPDHEPIGHEIPFAGGIPYHWNALVGGSAILTAHGMLPIEAVDVGTEVFTHRGRLRRVTETMRKPCESGVVRCIHTDTGRVLLATDEHPILTLAKGWTRADTLHVGDQCMEYIQQPLQVHASVDHAAPLLFRSSTIDTIAEVPCNAPVYNLAVDEDESYIAEGLVVHNCRSVMIPIVAGAGSPQPETFTQFLDRRGGAFQDAILGRARARLYRSGELSSLTLLLEAATGRPLTLEELGA